MSCPIGGLRVVGGRDACAIGGLKVAEAEARQATGVGGLMLWAALPCCLGYTLYLGHTLYLPCCLGHTLYLPCCLGDIKYAAARPPWWQAQAAISAPFAIR